MDTEAYERLAALEANMASQTAAFLSHAEKDEAHQALVMTALNGINEKLSKQRGFFAGIIFAASAVAGAAGLGLEYLRTR